MLVDGVDAESAGSIQYELKDALSLESGEVLICDLHLFLY
jgi:hypothetical protein